MTQAEWNLTKQKTMKDITGLRHLDPIYGEVKPFESFEEISRRKQQEHSFAFDCIYCDPLNNDPEITEEHPGYRISYVDSGGVKRQEVVCIDCLQELEPELRGNVTQFKKQPFEFGNED